MNEFYISKYRDFGKILEDTLKYSIKNWKPLLMLYLVFAMPFYVLTLGVSSFYIPALNRTISANLEDLSDIPFEFSAVSLLVGLGSMLSIVAYSLAIYSFMKYEERRQSGATAEENWWRGTTDWIKQQSWTYIVVNLAYAGIFILSMILVLALTAFAPFIGIFFWPIWIVLLLYSSVIFQMSLPAAVDLPGGSLADIIRKAFELVKGRWWYTFGIIIVLGLIRGVINAVLSIPFMAAGLGQAFSTEDPAALEALTNGWYLWLSNAFSVFFYAIVVVGVCFHYYSLMEQKEGTSLRARVAQFDEEEDDSDFSNEGTY